MGIFFFFVECISFRYFQIHQSPRNLPVVHLHHREYHTPVHHFIPFPIASMKLSVAISTLNHYLSIPIP